MSNSIQKFGSIAFIMDESIEQGTVRGHPEDIKVILAAICPPDRPKFMGKYLGACPEEKYGEKEE